MKRITSRQNPLVAEFRGVARGDRPGLLLDGAHLVGEALAAGIRVRQAVVTDDARWNDEIAPLVERLTRSGVNIALVAPPVMAAVSPMRSSGAIVAVAERRNAMQDQVYGNGRRAPLVVIACDVQDPGNVGAIVRVAEAAGATGVIAAGRSADPFGPKALRGSMGSALRLATIAAGDAAAAVSAARAHGCLVHAATPRAGRSLFDLDLTRPVAILVGSEGTGLPPALESLADERFTIPMEGDVESLNTAVAAALVLYEAKRQRDRAKNDARGT